MNTFSIMSEAGNRYGVSDGSGHVRECPGRDGRPPTEGHIWSPWHLHAGGETRQCTLCGLWETKS